MASDEWNPALFRAQAQYWREQAAKLVPGDEQAVCLAIAEGYGRLASLVEERQGSDPPGPSAQDASDQC